jgi:hypothetical protein
MINERFGNERLLHRQAMPRYPVRRHFLAVQAEQVPLDRTAWRETDTPTRVAFDEALDRRRDQVPDWPNICRVPVADRSAVLRALGARGN